MLGLLNRYATTFLWVIPTELTLHSDAVCLYSQKLLPLRGQILQLYGCAGGPLQLVFYYSCWDPLHTDHCLLMMSTSARASCTAVPFTPSQGVLTPSPNNFAAANHEQQVYAVYSATPQVSTSVGPNLVSCYKS